MTLDQCLREFTAEEKLSGNDTYYCSTCKTHQDAVKFMRIFRCAYIYATEREQYYITLHLESSSIYILLESSSICIPLVSSSIFILLLS